jgi:hypothetical protein
VDELASGRVTCPFCGATDTALVGAWGGTLLTRQNRCAACRTYFESVREPAVRLPFGPAVDGARAVGGRGR